MISIIINNNVYRYPEKWEEVGVKGIYAYTEHIRPNLERIYVSETDVNTELYRQILTLIFGEITGMTHKEWLKVSVQQWSKLLLDKALNFMFTTPPFILRLPLKSIEIDGTKYIAPSDKFENICAEEFHFTDMYFNKYYESNDIKWLYWLAATLYRPATLERWKQRNDMREVFNRHLIDDRFEVMQKLPVADLYLLAIWYESCRSLLGKICPALWEEASGKSKDNKGWVNVIWSLARHNPAFGDIESIKEKNLIELLINLQDMAVEADELEQKLKTA